MQIKNILLYNKVGEVRTLSFEIGKVNIITGESKSGKTALIDIVDYCLGSKDCKVAAGIIKDSVYWFAITLVLNKTEELFIARLNPKVKGVGTISEVYIEPGLFKTHPLFDTIIPNSNLIGLKELLSRKLNIAENLQVAENNTRNSLEVNFKHARIFCYQPQTLIAQRDYLFYNQTEPFVPQAIKDSIPYFLGAIREDSLAVEQEISRKRRELNKYIRERNENEKIKADGVSKAFSLFEEAKEIGIINNSRNVSTIQEALNALNEVKDWEFPASTPEVNGENSILKELLQRRNDYAIELGKLEDTISATRSFIKSNFSYSEEVKQQKIRLESINIFNQDSSEKGNCPLCDSILSSEIPAVSAIKESLLKLNSALETTVREKPRLNEYLNGLIVQGNSFKEQILKTEQSITALYTEQANARRLRDLNLRRGKVIGRASLFLESVDFSEDKTIDIKINNIRTEIEELSLLVDKESKEDKLASIINKINLQMSRWVTQLDVEYENSPIRFDISKLTVIADTPTESIPLAQMGSGANWVNYHLLVHFAFHKHFVQAKRPVPRFLMIDQPSQVYFPPEKDLDNNGVLVESADEIAVRKMFDFIINTTESLDGSFQVIVMDHAFLQNDKFRQSVREIWRNGLKLVPNVWFDITGNENEL